MSGGLKLRATDGEDLKVVAACLQDAVLPVGEMTYQPRKKRFVMVVSRFRWETVEGPPVEGRIYERVHTGVRFDGVKTARVSGIDRRRRGDILSLLTVEPNDGQIDLIFSGGGVIRLEIERVLCHLEDIDEPWPTQWKPEHPEAEAE